MRSLVSSLDPLWPCISRYLLVALVTAAALGGCGESPDSSTPDSSIVIDREVRLEGMKGTPQAIVRTSDGGFVIAGSWGNGWAAGTTSTGTVRWRYADPESERSPVASGFNGAVALADGNVLLCGQHHRQALVTILDENGQLVERRDILPPDGNAAIFLSSIHQCLRWNDGVALVGGGSDGRQPSFWLVKLDKNGREEWGRVSDGMAASSAIQAPNGDLIIARTEMRRSELARFDHLGNRVGRRLIEGLSLQTMLLRPSGAAAEYALAVRYGETFGDVTMLTLTKELQDARGPIHIAPVSIGFPVGSGYALPDGSGALFGVARGQSAVARVGGHGKSDVVHVFPRPDVGGATVSVGDAVPISGNQFVAVRDEVTAGTAGRSSMVLSWVTFQ